MVKTAQDGVSRQMVTAWRSQDSSLEDIISERYDRNIDSWLCLHFCVCVCVCARARARVCFIISSYLVMRKEFNIFKYTISKRYIHYLSL